MEIPKPLKSDFEPEITKAFNMAAQSVEQSPTPRNWARLAAIYHAHQELNAAIAAYQQAVYLGDAHSRTAHLLAMALDEVGDRDEAIASMERAAALKPYSQPSQWRLAQWKFEAGEDAEAEQIFLDAYNNNSEDKLTLQATAKYLIDSGQPKKAIGPLVKLIKISPTNRYARFLLGTAMQRSGTQADDAKSFLEVGRHAKPSWTDVHMQALSQLTTGPRADFLRLVQRSNSGKARESIAALESLEPRLGDDPGYHIEVCKCLRQIGSYAKAHAAIEKALAIEPGNFRATYQQAGLIRDDWISMGKPEGHALLEKALEKSDHTIGLNPTNAPSHALRAQVLEDMGRFEESYQSWMEADRLDRADQRFSYQGARTILQSGDRDRGIELLGIYCDRFPLHHAARKQLGLEQWKGGDSINAQRNLSMASQGLPGDPEIRQAIDAMSRQ
ncbi:MAG: hypothetical protein CMJ40_04145 [Phycisphaerae bacterium]|nr:hypothetical protein [Phycisphaerae bacterium]